MKPSRPTAILILAASLQCSCSIKQVELDLSQYPELPAGITARSMRAVVNSNKFMRTRALWGNYGGPDSVGGVPTDAMDECFRQHDLAYLQGVTNDDLLEADQRLISQLEALDPASLSPEADTFRRRAIRYFSRPISHVLGKPPNVLFGLKDRPVIIDTSPRPETK